MDEVGAVDATRGIVDGVIVVGDVANVSEEPTEPLGTTIAAWRGDTERPTTAKAMTQRLLILLFV